MKNLGAQTYNYPAIQIVPHDPIAGASGWNLIGGYENTVATSGLTTTPPGLIGGPVYGYLAGPGYYITDNLVPGYGYWIKLTGAGVINIPPEPLSKGTPEVVEYIKDDWGKIIITDNAGRSYTLYAVKGEVDLNNYELPPLPPGGVFDARFTTDNMVENISKESKRIKLSSASYPITIRVEGLNLKVNDIISGDIINEDLHSGERLVISDPKISFLKISGNLTAGIPVSYELYQNYPNPFNPSTVIKFALPKDSKVNVTVFNILGEKAGQLINQEMKAGYHQVDFDASHYASGVYLYSITAGDFVETKKMVLMK